MTLTLAEPTGPKGGFRGSTKDSGGGGGATCMRQNDPNDALIILRYVSWGVPKICTLASLQPSFKPVLVLKQAAFRGPTCIHSQAAFAIPLTPTPPPPPPPHTHTFNLFVLDDSVSDICQADFDQSALYLSSEQLCSKGLCNGRAGAPCMRSLVCAVDRGACVGQSGGRGVPRGGYGDLDLDLVADCRTPRGCSMASPTTLHAMPYEMHSLGPRQTLPLACPMVTPGLQVVQGHISLGQRDALVAPGHRHLSTRSGSTKPPSP